MGNCLVTKLKGVVNNNNLKRLGEVEFLVFNGSNITVTSSVAFKARTKNLTSFDVKNATSGSSIASGVTEYTCPANTKISLIFGSEDSCFVELYNVTGRLALIKTMVELSDLKYIPTITEFVAYNGDVDESYAKSIVNAPTQLTMLTAYGDSYYGTFADIKQLVNLTTCIFGSLTGDIIWDFAVPQIQSGRQSATIQFAYLRQYFDTHRMTGRPWQQLSWEQSGANYIVTFKQGNSASSIEDTWSVTIDANGNKIS